MAGLTHLLGVHRKQPIGVSLSLFLFLPPTHFSLALKSINVSSGEDLKMKKNTSVETLILCWCPVLPTNLTATDHVHYLLHNKFLLCKMLGHFISGMY